MAPDTKEVYRKIYGDAQLIVYQVLRGHYAPVPFYFEIVYRGQTHKFPTIPNRCLTKKAAIMRGYHRCCWFNNGTFHEKYRPMFPKL